MKGSRVPAYISLAILTVFAGFPVFWMFETSLKTHAQLGSYESMFWPRPFAFANYSNLFTRFHFAQWVWNTILVSSVVTLFTIAAAAFGAYALARMRFRGRDTLAASVLITYLVPGSILFIPMMRLVKSMHLDNSLWSLIVAYPTFTVPLAAWMLLGFFKTIPAELDEAAMIDGADRLRILLRITLPLAKPGLVAAALFSFTNSWNEFIYALVFNSKTTLQTLTVGLTNMVMGDVYLWGELMAGAILASLPVVVLYLWLQKYVVAGLTAGAVKG